MKVPTEALLLPISYEWRNRGTERGHIFYDIEDEIQPRRQAGLEPCTVGAKAALIGSSNQATLNKVLGLKRSL